MLKNIDFVKALLKDKSQEMVRQISDSKWKIQHEKKWIEKIENEKKQVDIVISELDGVKSNG